MLRLIFPTIFIGIAIAAFFTFTKPFYNQIVDLRAQVSSYNDALTNSNDLEKERETLTKKYNAFDPNDLGRLVKMLPDNVDNIRLILEMEKIARQDGMLGVKDVKYDTTQTTTATKPGAPGTTGVPPATAIDSRQDYGAWNLEFSTQGSYNDFIRFLQDIEKNLRIVDITSIDFSSSTGLGANPALANVYKYNFKIKTYWLKN